MLKILFPGVCHVSFMLDTNELNCGTIPIHSWQTIRSLSFVILLKKQQVCSMHRQLWLSCGEDRTPLKLNRLY